MFFGAALGDYFGSIPGSILCGIGGVIVGSYYVSEFGKSLVDQVYINLGL